MCHNKCYITIGIQPIFKNFPSAERSENRIGAENLMGAPILVLQWQGENY